MDWGKIKNIMIISLIFLNIFLGYNIYSSSNRFVQNTPVEKDVYNDVKNILREKNIFVEVVLESYKNPINGIFVEYETFDEEKISKFFEESEYDRVENLFVSKNKFIRITDETEMEYSLINVDDEINYTTSINAEKIAIDFLKRYDYYFSGLEPYKIYFNKGNVVIEYRQMYNELFLDTTYMKIEINNENVVNFSRKWFDTIRENENIINVIPPSEAMFNLIEKINKLDINLKKNEKLIVQNLELGYKLDDNIFFSSIRAGDALPYWKVTLGGNKIIYIEAINQ